MIFYFAFICAVITTYVEGSPPVRCAGVPKNLAKCLGPPRILNPHLIGKCVNIEDECQKITCILTESGWMSDNKVDVEKMKSFFAQFEKDYPEWKAAVNDLETSCLSAPLKPQGINLNCPAYDTLLCILGSFAKNAKDAQWSKGPECEEARKFSSGCPMCPEDCFAPAIPIGSCNACYALPRA